MADTNRNEELSWMQNILDESLDAGLSFTALLAQLQEGRVGERYVTYEGRTYLLRSILEPVPHILLSMLLQ